MSEMKRFWDERADEDAFYFVDNTLEYGAADEERFWAEGPRALDEILGALGVTIEPGSRVVEIGCGVGRMTRAMAEAGATVRAVDVSERMLELARRHNDGLAGVEWVLGDGSSLGSIGDGDADACFSHVVFQHIPDPRITLGYVREMGRVLRPGGWAAFGISNLPEIHRRASTVGRARAWLRARRGHGPAGQAHPAWRGSAVDLRDLDRTAAESGLDVERVAGAGTQFCYVLARRGERTSS
jgi:SAM-dependent methyltransferase